MTELFEITFTGRRWRWYPFWLPFGACRVVMTKRTTRQDVDWWCTRLVEDGLRDVGYRWVDE